MKSFVIIIGLFFAIKAERRVIPQPFENKHGLWTGPIVLGTPKQPQQLHLDTTSGDFFVIDSQCKTAGCNLNRKGFDGSKSSTFKKLPLRIPYSTTRMGTKQSGRLAFDCLTGTGAAKPTCIPFPLVDETSGNYTKHYGDGVFGLGLTNSKFPIPITFFRLMSNVFMRDSAYSFHVDKFIHTKANGFEDSGFGIYGGIDADHCDEGTVTYHAISKSDQWTLKLENFVSNGFKFKGGQVLIKPGPFQIFGPKSEIDIIYQALKVKHINGEPSVNCSKINIMPDLEMTIDGKTQKISSKDYTVQSDDNTCYLLFKVLDPNTSNGVDWVMGDVLFRSRCVVFSFNKKAIGFTARK